MLTSNYPVNRSDFKITRGVQNEILFFVRDLDRNPAITTSFSQVTINIVDPASSTLMMSRNLSVVDAPSALYQLTVLASETASWETGPLNWSMTVTRTDGSTVMLWTDMDYGGGSTLEVCAGPVPQAAAPVTLDPSAFTITNGVAISSALPGAAQLGYQNGMQTFALYMVNFTGSVEIDGSLQQQPSDNTSWFPIQTTNYSADSNLETVNIIGNYLWMRVILTTASGSISQILYKN